MNMLDILKPEIAFDGWAIAIIIFILTLLSSGVYISTRVKIKQKQKAGKGAKQTQKVTSSSLKDENNISQKQKAGDNSEQNQTA